MLTDAWSPGRAAGKPEHVHLANQQLSKVSRSKLSCLLWCVSCLLSSSMTQFAFSLRRVYWYLLLRLLPTLCPLSLYSTSYMSVFTLKKNTFHLIPLLYLNLPHSLPPCLKMPPCQPNTMCNLKPQAQIQLPPLSKHLTRLLLVLRHPGFQKSTQNA